MAQTVAIQTNPYASGTNSCFFSVSNKNQINLTTSQIELPSQYDVGS